MRKLLFTGALGLLGNNIRLLLEKTFDIHSIGLANMDDILKNGKGKYVDEINY